jgi:NitT/TauT family transport system substrate-binding protein
MAEGFLMQIIQSRRDFLAGVSAGATGVLFARGAHADDGPPEVTTLRFPKRSAICVAPRYLAGDLLRAEGFTDVKYIAGLPLDAVCRGDLDFDVNTAAWAVSQLNAGKPLTVLAGVHAGCYELFAHGPIRTISDLKGRRLGIPQRPGSAGHLLLSIMIAEVGLDPRRDINWVTSLSGDFLEAFARREVDAFLGFPPEPQELRARKIGHVILNTTTDKPWSQYFCCMAFGNRDFIRRYPVATKRVLRAIVKAADICATDPEWAARRLVEGGFTDRYDYALQTFTEVPYNVWREYDPEDSLRFYALRLNEVDMIRSTPQEIIAEGTDWRFLNQLKRELKA